MSRNDMSAEIARTIIQRLKAAGVQASYEEMEIEEEYGGGVQRSIVCRNADREAVERVMRDVLG